MLSSRDQYYKSKTTYHQILRLLPLLLVIIIALIGLYLFSRSYLRYTPPEFDSNAQNGTPSPEESLQYGTLETDYGYDFSLAANLYQQENADLLIYFTNPESNNVNLMCEVADDDSGKVLYKSGVIKPGEYIEKLSPEYDFPNEAMNVTVSVYAFEPDDWYSAGTTTLSLILQPW